MHKAYYSIALGLAVAGPLGWAEPAKAEFESGDSILKECEVSRSSSTYYQSNAFCIGYLSGVVDALSTLNALKGETCGPDDMTLEQLLDVVIKYLHDNPQSRHASAALVTWSAMNQAYGCSLPGYPIPDTR